MKITKVYCAYFSPGGTTKQVVTGIGEAFQDYPMENIDLTDYDVRQESYSFNENHLLIIGAPSYGGRLPVPVSECLSRFHGISTPVVLAATYGNRAVGDTLMELKKIMGENGFIPMAAGTFSCQHNFLSALACGRPDDKDMEIIHRFGEELRERLRTAVIYDRKELDIPGSYPYEKEPLTSLPFQVETNEYCFYCMLCASVCPMRAVSESNPKDINHAACVRCGACIRICPAQAKSFTKKPFQELQDTLLKPYMDTRCEPWYTIG